MEEVTKDVENIMESEIARSITTFEYDANRELLERFYGAVETHLREELARARKIADTPLRGIGAFPSRPMWQDWRLHVHRTKCSGRRTLRGGMGDGARLSSWIFV